MWGELVMGPGPEPSRNSSWLGKNNLREGEESTPHLSPYPSLFLYPFPRLLSQSWIPSKGLDQGPRIGFLLADVPSMGGNAPTEFWGTGAVG